MTIDKMHYVKWADANFGRDEAPPLATIRSCGWLVEDRGNALVFAAERIEDGGGPSYRDFTTVPYACVIEYGPVEIPE